MLLSMQVFTHTVTTTDEMVFMVFDFLKDKDFLSISDALKTDGELLKDAWIDDGTHKWYPVLVTERATGVRGFDIKPDSNRGKDKVICRKKIHLEDFLLLLAHMGSTSNEHVRCKYPTGNQKNSKSIIQLKFSPRMQGLLNRVRSTLSVP